MSKDMTKDAPKRQSSRLKEKYRSAKNPVFKGLRVTVSPGDKKAESEPHFSFNATASFDDFGRLLDKRRYIFEQYVSDKFHVKDTSADKSVKEARRWQKDEFGLGEDGDVSNVKQGELTFADRPGWTKSSDSSSAVLELHHKLQTYEVSFGWKLTEKWRYKDGRLDRTSKVLEDTTKRADRLKFSVKRKKGTLQFDPKCETKFEKSPGHAWRRQARKSPRPSKRARPLESSLPKFSK